MVFAVVDRVAGTVDLVQAGHPHPMLLRRSGQILRLGTGGLPVGLLPDARYETFSLSIESGDRLVLVSDGITECPRQTGDDFGEEGLADSLCRSAQLNGSDLLEALVWDLGQAAGTMSFPDDVSGVALDLLQQ
jgi:sigma-B regulation protein RsbU (phosphoserine phosphatase)